MASRTRTIRTDARTRRDTVTELLREMFDRLLAAFGPRNWWPGDTPFEVMVGAVLTQNTAWTNVEKAIANLKAVGLLNPEGLDGTSHSVLAELIRPSGYYRVKADRLKNMAALVREAGGGDPPLLLQRPLAALRPQLLAVNGIGPETADSILLYAAGYPVFVIDAYTRRVLSRHGLIDGNEPYEQLQRLFMDRLPQDAPLYNEFHALLVQLGKMHCRPRPICRDCPLDGFGGAKTG